MTRMDVREKLVNVVKRASYLCLPSNTQDFHINMFVTDLIAHGVTVQEWISVNDRLPERTLPPKDVLVYHDLGCGMFVDRAWYSYDKKRWCSVLGMKLKVTHWMPLPEPPEAALKGGEG